MVLLQLMVTVMARCAEQPRGEKKPDFVGELSNGDLLGRFCPPARTGTLHGWLLLLPRRCAFGVGSYATDAIVAYGVATPNTRIIDLIPAQIYYYYY